MAGAVYSSKHVTYNQHDNQLHHDVKHSFRLGKILVYTLNIVV